MRVARLSPALTPPGRLLAYKQSPPRAPFRGPTGQPRMKPAAFRYHQPTSLAEAVVAAGGTGAGGRPHPRRRAEPGADHGVPHGAAGASDRHQRGRRARPARESTDGRLRIGARVRHAAFHRPVVDNPLGAAALLRRAPHRALSDPHARHLLRQPRACRSVLRMVPDRGDARRHHASPAARAANARSRGRRDFFDGHHDDRISPRTNCWPRRACRCCRPTRHAASTNSAAAPATIAHGAVARDLSA